MLRLAAGAFLLAPLAQLAGEKLDLIANRRIAVEQYDLLTFDPAAPAVRAVPRFTQQFLRAHEDIHFLGAGDQLLQSGFLAVLCL